MAYTREQIVNLALSYNGATQGSKKHKDLVDTFNKTKPHGEIMNYTAAWCACTVTAWLLKGGYTPSNMPMSYNCGQLIRDAQKLGVWVENDSFTPNPGDLIIYYWGDNGKGDCSQYTSHVGMVYRVQNGKFYVIEGNKSKKVAIREMNINGRYIRGFCHLKFTPYKAAKVSFKPTTKYTGKFPSSTLYFGHQGDQVKYLQAFLNWALNYKLDVDGDLGQKTSYAIQDFQSTYGLVVDGSFGPKSLAKAKSIADGIKVKVPVAYSGAFPVLTTSTTRKGAKIASKANELAYKTNTKDANYPKGKPTAAFKSALSKYYKGFHFWSTASKKGASCDVFVGTVVRASGVDSKFPAGLWKQLAYMKKNMVMMKADINKLQDGDIGFYRKNVKGKHGHIFIYAYGKIKEASAKTYYGKTTNSVNTRFSSKGKKYVYIFRFRDSAIANQLKKGSKGTNVEKLQKYLNWYFGSNVLKVDGDFGAKTEEKVKKFQEQNKLKVDGVVGVATLDAMKKIKK